MIKSPRFKIGDKIRYIGTQNHPSKTEIFTVKGVETEGSEYRYTVEESSNWWFAEHIIDIVLPRYMCWL